MELERIHYSNGMAIYDKKIWEATLEHGHLLKLIRDGETQLFMALDGPEDADKDCYPAMDTLEESDLQLVAEFIDRLTDGHSDSSKKARWHAMIEDLMVPSGLGPCIIHYPSRRVIWMGYPWHMLQCHMNEYQGYITIFRNDQREITYISGNTAVPRLLSSNDFGFLVVTSYGVSIEHI